MKPEISVRFEPAVSYRKRTNASSGQRTVSTPPSEISSRSVSSVLLPSGNYGIIPVDSASALSPTVAPKMECDGMLCTEVNPNSFVLPIQPIDVSGGTAAFYALELAHAKEYPQYWIGKDLKRAKDEVEFYECALMERMNLRGKFLPLVSFMFEYAGVARCPTSAGAECDVLVMKNLMDGCSKLRLLDLKIGDKTADAGWKGKSRVAAFRQSLVDSWTNSVGQGFRLEGFDQPPDGLASQDPLLDFGGSKGWSKAMVKKANRVHLQRLPAADIFMHFLDVREMHALEGETTITACEWAESVLLHIVQRLVRLQKACDKAPVPQKWIGSSVALGFDCGFLPSRISVLDWVSELTKVHIFDWGRSEFNTVLGHENLSGAEKRDRKRFWGSYRRGINRLAWEAARAYIQRFSCTLGWSTVQIHVFDFDSSSDNDYIGSATIPLKPCDNLEVTLTWAPPTVKVPGIHGGLRGSCCRSCAGCITRCSSCLSKKEGLGKVVVSVEWRDIPEGSAIVGMWRVHLHRAVDLIFTDLTESKADPMAVITAFQIGGHGLNFHQLSKVIVDTFNPVWEEVFELPIASSSTRLQDTLKSEGTNTRMLKSMSSKNSYYSWTSGKFQGTDWQWFRTDSVSSKSDGDRAHGLRAMRSVRSNDSQTDRDSDETSMSANTTLRPFIEDVPLEELNRVIPVEPTPLIENGEAVLRSPRFDMA